MNLKISHRLSLGFGVLISLTVIFGAFSIIKLHSLWQSTANLYDHPFTVSNAVRDIRSNIIAMHREMKDIALAKTTDQIHRSSAKVDVLEKDVLSLFDVVSERFLGDIGHVNETHQSFIDWKVIRDEVIALQQAGERLKAAEITKGKGAAHVAKLNADIQFMITFASTKAESYYEDAEKTKNDAVVFIYILLAALSILGISVSFFTVRQITSPLSKIARNIKKIAHGDLEESVDVRRGDEIGQVAESLRDLVDTLKDTARQADIIATGDYSEEIAPRSDVDKLGFAMQAMTQTLSEISEENIEKDWLAKGQVELYEQLRGDLSLDDVSSRVITFVANYLGAQVGTMHVTDKDGDVLRLRASYAHTVRKNLANEYRLGEGLVGQAALEKSHIVLSQCPVDYIRIQSGLGESVPRNIMVYPLLMNNEVKAVIELGSFREFSDRDLSFMQQVQESIAMSINSVASRNQLAMLLEKTQGQAEALQAQEEELRQTNEELREHTAALKESEIKLQAQSEELQQSNEELEEQAEQLEEQKESIEKKNRELEKARELIEEKVADLEITSKYKSEFLANMSHELRTPLNSILLLSKLLADNKDGSLTEDQVESAKAIYTSGGDLLMLINEVLDLSKIEAGKMDIRMTDLKLESFAASMAQAFQPLVAEKGIGFKTRLMDDLPQTIQTDRQRLEQIVRNFLSNAVKFTHQGSVTLEISRHDEKETSLIDFPTEGTGPTRLIAFSVIDTGIGIPTDKQKLIFEAFQQADGTTSRKYGGTGLGLSISREIAKILGGKVILKSTPGEGSVFTLLLPEDGPAISADVTSNDYMAPQDIQTEQPELPTLAPADSDNPPNQESFIVDDRKNLSPNDKSILIIEDDQKFLKILRDLSREHGFKCIVATDGETGLQFADYYRPSAIILDIGLPGIDGWTVMSQLKDNLDTRHIPVHFISASDRKLEAMKMGAVDFLLKPVTPDVLEHMYDGLNQVISKKVKDLLVVEDDLNQQMAIAKLIGNGDVKITAATTAGEAFDALLTGKFDAMVLDLGLPDMSGLELIQKVRDNDITKGVPIIIYTGRELSAKENAIIEQYTESTIIKGVESHQKLIDETMLFLHRVEAGLPEEQRELLKMMYDKEAAFSNKTVLVVDDDMRNVFSIKKILEGKKMRVLVGKTGIEGLDQLDANPDIHLVLMDIMMPEMDGYEAIREIRKQEQHKDLPIIALTAKAMKGDRAKCIEAGASDYLAKPVDGDRLLSVMRVWLYGKS